MSGGLKAQILRVKLLKAISSLSLILLGSGFGVGYAQTAPTQIGNDALSLHWQVSDHHLKDLSLFDSITGKTTAITMPFSISLSDGKTIKSDQLILTTDIDESELSGDDKASRASEHVTRKQITAHFSDVDQRFSFVLKFIQPKGAAYIREEVSITPLKQDEAIIRADLFNVTETGAQIVGKVNGSPIVAENHYWLFEDPLSQGSASLNGRIQMWIERSLPLVKGQTISYSAVVGVTHKGQLRRDFLAYIEAERAHPYRTFLHYNSWYDTGYFTPYTEADALDRIHAFGQELHVKRGVKLDSFLFDDGWDDRSGKWNFSKDFPKGFIPLKEAAAQYGAAPGVWLSPWGGYSQPKQERVAAGKDNGFEIIDGGFALSGPHYYDNFHAATMKLLLEQGVNQFKFDGTGNANKVFPGSRFDSDFGAAIALIGDLRRAKPDLFINLTTGTYPSPAWLRYADTIWRDGEDHDFTGVGTWREKWITYRDRETYEYVVVAGPLFPLNALMLHGIIYAQHAKNLDTDPSNDFANEVHDYFATGTSLQEMYITPSRLTKDNWDVLAQAANWSRANADVLKDTHWVGGNPGRLDVYGWAAYAPRKSIITLRNPDQKKAHFVLDVQKALELPDGVARLYKVSTPWKRTKALAFKTLKSDKPLIITLEPFEVLTLELTPVSKAANSK